MGYNPVLFDEIIAMIMGFDFDKIPTIVSARAVDKKFRILEENDNNVIIRSNDKMLDGLSLKDKNKIRVFQFVPTSGWLNHIEL